MLRLPSTHFGHSCFAETRAFFFGAVFMWRPAAVGSTFLCVFVLKGLEITWRRVVEGRRERGESRW